MKFEMRRPDNAHFHPRWGREMLKITLPYTSSVFRRGIAMGNLSEPRGPVVSVADAVRWRNEMLQVDRVFKPIVPLMLVERTSVAILRQAKSWGFRFVKYIPSKASVGADQGGIPLEGLLERVDLLEELQKLEMFLLMHLELVSKNGVDIPEVDREAAALPYLDRLVQKYPKLNIVVEHASDAETIDYVKRVPANVSATLTVHHAILTYDDVCNNEGLIINPYNYCKPIAKAQCDQSAVLWAMFSGNPKFYCCDDSAPHLTSAKEAPTPAAGIFTAPVTMLLFCQIFEQHGALRLLEDFMSRFAAERYGWRPNEGKLVMVKEKQRVLEVVGQNVGGIRVFMGGLEHNWRVASVT